MPKSLAEVAQEEFASNPNEIFSIIYEDKKYWVKKARATYSHFWHKFFYRLFSFDVLIPTETKTGQETIAHETAKLDGFRQKGINTPRVIYKCEAFFVLEDCGEAVHAIIRNSDISEERLYYYINMVVEELSKIHNNGFFHGGAQTRNFTYSNSKIYAIDLEESFDEKIDIEVLQFRDFLLLLLSFTKIKAPFDVNYSSIIDAYVAQTNNTKTVKKLRSVAKKISFLIYISEFSWVQRFLGSDAKAFFKLFKILKNL